MELRVVGLGRLRICMVRRLEHVLWTMVPAADILRHTNADKLLSALRYQVGGRELKTADAMGDAR